MLYHTLKKPRGFALALTLFLIVLLATVCFGALNVTTLDSRTTTEDYKSSRAFYAARAGIAFAKSELTDSARVSLTSVHTYPKTYLQLSGGGTAEEAFSLVITPASDNLSRVFRIWKVESTGYYDNASRKVVAFIEQESFAKYGYFTDVETNQSGRVIQFCDQDQLTGSVHTNGYFTIDGHPRFANQMSSANNGDSRYTASTGIYKRTDNRNTADNKDFYHAASNDYTKDRQVALNDSPDFSFAGGQESIPLPKSTSADIIDAATAADTKFQGNYRIVFTEDGKAKYYKQKTSNNNTYYEGFPTYAGQPDNPEKVVDTKVSPGVTMYVNGNVEISGTVKGRCTLCASKNMYIVDDVQYENDNNCVLGLLSEQSIIVRTNQNVNQDLYLDAIVMALNGSFTVENYDKGSYRGKLHLFGGVIQNKRGPVATSRSGGGSIVTGYAKDYVYDPKLESMPPLNFPNTGKFRLRYFIDRGSLGGV